MRRHQRAQARAVDERDVVHVQHDFLFAFGDQALHFFAQRVALFAQHDAPVKRNHRHAVHFPLVIFKATFFPPHRKAVPAATRAGTTKLINNSPRTTCNNRRLGKPICNAAIPAAASTPDNSAKHLPPRPPRTVQLSLARHLAQIPQPALAEPGQVPVSRHYSRPVVYSTSPANCVAQGALASRPPLALVATAITHRGTTRCALRRGLLSCPTFSLLSLISTTCLHLPPKFAVSVSIPKPAVSTTTDPPTLLPSK